MQVAHSEEYGTSNKVVENKGKKLIYIAFFLVTIIVMNNVSGGKATYKYLLLVLATVILYRWNDYKIEITTPTILKGV
jgi:hypothetical protein